MVKWMTSCHHVVLLLKILHKAGAFGPWTSIYSSSTSSSSSSSSSISHIGKITYDFPYIPLTATKLKKMRDRSYSRAISNMNSDSGSEEIVRNGTNRLQASERLLIDPSVHLGDLTDPDDVEELVLAGFVPEEPEDGSVRLQGSRLDYMGRVEVYHNHQWGSVCGFQWDRADAEVVCRQMGYDTGRVIAVTRPEFGPANDIPVYYNYVDCDGSEERLADCYAKKNFSRDGLVCNRWRRGATVICGCATETPKHGSRPRCMVSTAYPFDSYTCTYACNRGYTLEGVNMRQCLANQQWDTDLPRCVPSNNKGSSDTETKVAPRPKMNPETRSMKKVCKRPPNAYECGHNITDPIECDSLGGCFDRGIAPNCYYPECQNPNPCLNGGKCIAIGKPNLPFTCICADGWAGSQCQYKNIVETCGRSSYTGTYGSSSRQFLLNEIMNSNRKRRSSNPLFGRKAAKNHGLLEALLGIPKNPFISSSLDGISNEHLEHILKAGMSENSDDITINFIDEVNPRTSKTRIVGGHEVTSKKQHPWVVMIKIGWRYVCAGVLIAPKWVITAAHCGYEKHIKNNTAPGDSWTIIAGEKSQFEVSDVIVRIEKAIMHDYTHFEDDIPRNDLMLLKLDKELKQTDTINYACLPQNRFDTPKPGDMCTIAGWGVHNLGGDQPEFLNYAKIPIMSKKDCQSKHTNEKDYESISDDMICAGFDHGGTDACNGDSGGPLMCTREDNTVFLPGIISWGYECAEEDTPGVYTKNAHYLDWIHQTIHENS